MHKITANSSKFNNSKNWRVNTQNLSDFTIWRVTVNHSLKFGFQYNLDS